MSEHTKKLKEERDRKLKEEQDRINKELDKNDPEPSPSPSKSVPSASPSPSESVPSPSPTNSPSPSPSESVPSPSPSPSEQIPPEKGREYKKKFTSVSQENLIHHAQNQLRDKAVEEAGKVTVTDEEMKVEFPDWDLMDDTQKKIARKNAINDKRFAILEKSTLEGKDLEKWQTKVNGFVENPKTLIEFPELEGREEAFKVFAVKPTRRGLPIEDIVKAFLFDATKTAPLKNKGKMFPTGTPGLNDKGKKKTNKVSLAEAEKIRDTDYKRYKVLLKNNLIDFGDI